MENQVKICGIKTPKFIDICANAGADYIGFVNFRKSLRHVSLDTIAQLLKLVPKSLQSVVLKVNPNIEEIEYLAKYHPNYIQLHGSETPEFCALLKHEFDVKLIKAISVKTTEDIKQAYHYQDIVDMLLFDSKPTPNALLPGGNGEAFNWALLKNHTFNCKTMLAGGLNKDNVVKAKQTSGISIVDISSEVEITRGEKDQFLIEEFVRNSKA